MELSTLEELGKKMKQKKERKKMRQEKENKKARMTVLTLGLQICSS
jgi:hypothetical protein